MLLAVSLAACSVTQPSPGPTGTIGATASSGVTASASGTPAPTTPVRTPEASADSRSGTLGQVRSLGSPPKVVWQKSEAALLGGSDKDPQLMLVQASFFPGDWDPARGDQWIALLAGTPTSLRVRSIDLASGAIQWESKLNGPVVRRRCAVNGGPELVCVATDGLVFFDLATGKTRTMQIPGVAGVALEASGDLVTLAAAVSTSDPPEPRLVTLQRRGPDGSVRWSGSGTLTAYSDLTVTIAAGMVVVSGVGTSPPGQTVSMARSWSTGQPLAGVADGVPLSPMGRWLLGTTDHLSSRVVDSAGASFTVTGYRGLDDLIPRDLPPSALPLLTLTLESNATTLRAFDARGTELWSSPGQSAALCGGLLLTTDELKISARDPATGALRWQTDSVTVQGCDGTRALIVGQGTARAVDLATGRDVWQAPLPDGVGHVGSSGILIEPGKWGGDYQVYG